MAEEGSDHKPSGWAGNLTSAATILGAFIAAGQSGTALIKGWSDYKTAEIRAQHDLTADDLKNRSSLADSYLSRLLTKDISDPDKLMLLGALSSLKDHPLQKWAAERKDQLEDEYKAQLEERQKRIGQLESAAPEQISVQILQDSIESAKSRLVLVRENPAESQAVEDQISKYVQDLARIKAVSGLKIEVSRSIETDSGTSTTSALAETVDVTSKLTVDLILQAAPNAPSQNVRQFGPLLIAALKEYQLLDRKMIAYAIATVTYETLFFSPMSEPGSDQDLEARYGMRRDLGNTQAGDGARFRGRGFLQITGRFNYLRMSQRLDLGDLLVQSPNLANDPGIASRIFCAFIADAASRLKPALDRDDLVAARHAIAGSNAQNLDEMVQVYHRVLSGL